MFDGAKGEQRTIDEDAPDTRDYDVFNLHDDMEEGDEWNGQPYITKPIPGDHGTIALFYINNHENQEKLRGKLNLSKKANEDVDNIDKVSFFEGSLGYDVIQSIKELEGQEVEGFNVFTIPFEQFREDVNNLKKIEVLVRNHTSTLKNGDVINWNTFRVTNKEN